MTIDTCRPIGRPLFAGDCFRLIGSRRYRSARYVTRLSENQIRRERIFSMSIRTFAIIREAIFF